MAASISNTLVGISGEYYVAAELSQRGYVASVTLRNTEGIDILASNKDASRSVAIQVKTNRGYGKSWLISRKNENRYKENFFYVFVSLKELGQRPDFHIVQSKTVAKDISERHKRYLSTSGRGGKPHKDNPMRVFKDLSDEYLEKWELLSL
ncbi:hypothetical protein ACFLWX_03670 [Chloroflexota bacterium]